MTTIFAAAMFVSGCDRATQLPTVSITTATGEPIVTREWRDNTQIAIESADGSIDFACNSAAIRARGHSTFTKPKKPFALRLAEKRPLLGMAPSDKWILLANFMDHSLLRNSLALAIAKETSLAWTPDNRLVDVEVDGKAQGCYLLCESIQIGKDWVDLGSDGFLIEMDNYPADRNRFTTRHAQLPANVTHPQELTDSALQCIADYINTIEDTIYTADADTAALGRLMDIDSFVDWWIVHELTQNAEPNGPRSCYMHKGKDGKLHAGPVWDFDLAFINVGLDAKGDIRPERLDIPNIKKLDSDCLYNPTALWYGQLLKHPTFARRVHERWEELRPRFDALRDTLNRWRMEIAPSAKADEALWGGKDPARFDNHAHWDEAAENLANVYATRIDKLNNLIQTSIPQK